MKKTLAVMVLASVAVSVRATSVNPVSVEELVRDSDIVVSGQIVSGRTLADNCGVEVTIRVDVPIKGPYVAAATVTASIFSEYANIGSDRIFFISDTQHQISGMASTNSHDMNLMHNTWLRCKDVYPSYAVNLAGMAAPALNDTSIEKAKKVVSLNGFVIFPPPELWSRKEDPLKVWGLGRFDDEVWIEQSEFVEYLKNLAEGE